MTNINNLSLRIVRQIRSNFFSRCTNSYIRKKVTSRCPLDASAGRSMVEMLGVLAIIGVLSVGAIAGYSKAMFKYKLNKHTEQMNQVVNAIARNEHSFDNVKETNLTPIFIKMGEIPTEMVKANDNYYVYDIFGQGWQVNKGDNGSRPFIYLASFHMAGSSFLFSTDSLAICQNTFTIAKENSDNISGITIETADAAAYIVGKNCDDQNDDCLKNLTLDDIYTLCAEYEKSGMAALAFIWYL